MKKFKSYFDFKPVDKDHNKTLPSLGIFTYVKGSELSQGQNESYSCGDDTKHQLCPSIALVDQLSFLKRIKAGLEEITEKLGSAAYITEKDGILNGGKQEKQRLDHILGELALKDKKGFDPDHKEILIDEMYAYKHLQTLRWVLGLYYVRLLGTGIAQIIKKDNENLLRKAVGEKEEKSNLTNDLDKLVGDNPWVNPYLEAELKKIGKNKPSWIYRYLAPQLSNASETANALSKKFYAIAVYLDGGKIKGDKDYRGYRDVWYIDKLLDLAEVGSEKEEREKRDLVEWQDYTKKLNMSELEVSGAFDGTKIYNLSAQAGHAEKTANAMGLSAVGTALAYANLGYLAYKAQESNEARDWVALLGTAGVMMLDTKAVKRLANSSGLGGGGANAALARVLKRSVLRNAGRYLAPALDIGLAVWQLFDMKATDKDSQIASIITGFATGALVLLGAPVGWVIAAGILGSIITEGLKNSKLENWIESTYAGKAFYDLKSESFWESIKGKFGFPEDEYGLGTMNFVQLAIREKLLDEKDASYQQNKEAVDLAWRNSYSHQSFGYEIMQHLPEKFSMKPALNMLGANNYAPMSPHHPMPIDGAPAAFVFTIKMPKDIEHYRFLVLVRTDYTRSSGGRTVHATSDPYDIKIKDKHLKNELSYLAFYDVDDPSASNSGSMCVSKYSLTEILEETKTPSLKDFRNDSNPSTCELHIECEVILQYIPQLQPELPSLNYIPMGTARERIQIW